ncbi:hypothetical protein EVAR_66645_1 [Eumeta japonica]|uniref:Uncharacterized protein n=1 Tax=Eumeta variegata TaxID=151549 RepID=A0A4C2A6L8_EUMVA|nr:hypothetical protein EVAR_66645_1 [Eumeta japonica]
MTASLSATIIFVNRRWLFLMYPGQTPRLACEVVVRPDQFSDIRRDLRVLAGTSSDRCLRAGGLRAPISQD